MLCLNLDLENAVYFHLDDEDEWVVVRGTSMRVVGEGELSWIESSRRSFMVDS